MLTLKLLGQILLDRVGYEASFHFDLGFVVLDYYHPGISHWHLPTIGIDLRLTMLLHAPLTCFSKESFAHPQW